MLSRPEIPLTTTATRGKRAYFRAPVWLAATGFAWGHKKPFDGWVDNLSAGGMHVVCAFPPPPETACLFRLNTGGGEGRDVFVTGWVAHARTGGMGVQFDRMAPGAEPVIRRLINRYRGAAVAPVPTQSFRSRAPLLPRPAVLHGNPLTPRKAAPLFQDGFRGLPARSPDRNGLAG